MGDMSRASGAIVLLPHRRFTADGEAYVYATETGGLFRMDEAAGSALSALASSGASAVPPDVLSDLLRTGLLRYGEGGEPPVRSPLPALRVRTLVLMLTASCNLSCRYCYEAREDGCVPPAATGGPLPEMSAETFRKCIAFLLENSGESRKVSVVCFGGEPLLRFPLLRATLPFARAMAQARGKEISFSLTTNGTLLTPAIAKFLKENRVSVCISMDGPPEIHDRNRAYASGRGSYKDAARGLACLTEEKSGFPIAARVTLGRGAVDVRKTFDHLRGLGFAEVGFAPASAAEDRDAALTEEELERAMGGFRDLAAGYVADVRDRRMPAFSNLTQVLSLIHRGDPMPYPCGAGIGMLAVDPAGAFYPCHRLCGVADALGDPERGVADDIRVRFLEGAKRRRESACEACWAKNFCSGGCYHDAYLRQGDPFAPSTHYCRWIGELFLLGLETYVRIQNETPTFLDAMFGERGAA